MQFHQIIFVALLFTRSSHSTTVTLTVEGGVSLVGPHCPGTVRLFCEGVDLHYLSWTYYAGNESVDIVNRVLADDHVTSLPIIATNGAFVSATITNLSIITSSKANYSSTLTVNLFELNKHNIRNISCGDLSHKATQDVHIVDYFTSTINASYQFGILNTIEVQLYSICPEYNRSSLLNKISVFAPNDYITETRTCANASCSTTFTKFSTKNDMYNLIIEVSNNSHKLKEFEITIAYRSENYLIWNVIENLTSCQQLTIQCIATQAKAVQGITTCEVQHRTDDSILNTLHLPINTQQHLHINPGAVHHFELSAMLTDSVMLFDTIRIEPSTIEIKEIFILAITSLFLLMALLHLFILFIVAFCKSTALISMKVAQLSIAVILFVLVLTCAALLFVFGITANDTCTAHQEYVQNIILNVMITIASMGIVLIVLTWVFTSHRLYKYRGMNSNEGSRPYHTAVNEITNAKGTDTVPRSRPISESISMSNQYYHRNFSEIKSNRRAEGSNAHFATPCQQPYDMLEHSKEFVLTTSTSSDYPHPEYAKLKKRTMDDPEGPDHYMRPISEEWPMPVLDRDKRYYSNVRPDKKPEAAETTHGSNPSEAYYTELSECYLLESHSDRIDPYHISPPHRPRDSFYESVILSDDYPNSEVNHQAGPRENFNPIPLPSRNIHVGVSKPDLELIEKENDQQKCTCDTDHQNKGVQHQLRSGRRPKQIPIPPRHMRMKIRKQEPIEEESNT